MPYLGIIWGYIWAKILKNFCRNGNQHPQIYKMTKFCEKAKFPKLGTKNALFGYFWSRILKNYCHN